MPPIRQHSPLREQDFGDFGRPTAGGTPATDNCQAKSQAKRIQEVGLGNWLDEPMSLDEFYGPPGPSTAKPSKDGIFKRVFRLFR